MTDSLPTASLQGSQCQIKPADRRYRSWLTPERHAQILAVYAGGYKQGAIKRLAYEWDIDPSLIYDWAREMDLPRSRSWRRRVWDPREDELLEQHAHLSNAKVRYHLRRQGWHRSEVAIATRRRRLQLHRRDASSTGWYSAEQVATLLGYSKDTVLRWIRRKAMVADVCNDHARQNASGCSYYYRIHEDQLRQFLLTHPLLWDLRKVADHWQMLVILFPQLHFD